MLWILAQQSFHLECETNSFPESTSYMAQPKQMGFWSHPGSWIPLFFQRKSPGSLYYIPAISSVIIMLRWVIVLSIWKLVAVILGNLRICLPWNCGLSLMSLLHFCHPAFLCCSKAFSPPPPLPLMRCPMGTRVCGGPGLPVSTLPGRHLQACSLGTFSFFRREFSSGAWVA